MKITAIKNQQSFKKLYISSEGMGNCLNKGIYKIAKSLYSTTDSIDILDKMGIDMFIYADKENPTRCAKLALADRNGNILKLPATPNLENPEYREIKVPEDIPTPRMIMIRSTNKIFSLIDAIIFNGELEKLSNSQTSKEIKEIFSQNKENNYIVL